MDVYGHVHVRVQVFVYVFMYVYAYVCMYVCMCVCVKITRPQSPRDLATATPWLKCGSRTLSWRQKGASEL